MNTPKSSFQLPPSIIWVEGSIAVGKSTLVQKLSEMTGFVPMLEVVRENPYLDLFYDEIINEESIRRAGRQLGQAIFTAVPANLTVPAIESEFCRIYRQMPKEIALKMQLFILDWRFEQHLESQKLLESGTGSLVDRSMFGDLVFAKNLVQQGRISPQDFELIYRRRFDTCAKLIKKPDLVIYLKSQPDTCCKRCLNSRGRGAENRITFEYLEGLNAEYEELMQELTKTMSVLYLPWDEDRDFVKDDFSDVFNRLKEALAA